MLAAVYDLDTHQIWTIGSGRPQAEASVVKLNILDALLAKYGKGSGGLSGQDRKLARLMIEDSDNDAATALWDTAGGASGIRAFEHRRGPGGHVAIKLRGVPGFSVAWMGPDDDGPC